MTEPSDADQSADDTVPVRRTLPSATAGTDGTTRIARRETRRRAGREQPPGGASPASDRLLPSPPIATSGRIAATPDPASDAVYRARVPDPVIAVRSAPSPRIAHVSVDVAAGAASRRRGARRSALIVLISACLIVVAAAGSLLMVALAP